MRIIPRSKVSSKTHRPIQCRWLCGTHRARDSRWFMGPMSQRRPRVVVSVQSGVDESVQVTRMDDGSILYRFGKVSVDTSSPCSPAEPASDTDESVDGKDTHSGKVDRTMKISEMRSSWGAKEASVGAQEDADYLYSLGKSDLNLNIDTGQNAQNLDSIFTGNFLGHQSDIADGSLRGYEFRSFNNIVGDYYVAPKFLDAVVLHIVKNFLADTGAFDKATRVPLILGIWGGKGQGKSFQTELAFKKLGLEAVVMSAGELESEHAGQPGYLIRDRYRKAAELSKVRGCLSALLINDIDAGIGHFENTQLTVNNQMVTGTLMAICDNPNKVPRYGVEWREDEPSLQRVPIIVTGNDLSLVFAPLLRDGRMEKFYWQPTKTDLTNILFQMYKDDGLTEKDMVTILESFPNQSLDFYGALRAATYDNQIRNWIQKDVIDGQISEENGNLSELGKRLLSREDLPTFEPSVLKVEDLLQEGARLVQEQDYINSMKLSESYLKQQKKIGKSIIGLTG